MSASELFITSTKSEMVFIRSTVTMVNFLVTSKVILLIKAIDDIDERNEDKRFLYFWDIQYRQVTLNVSSHSHLLVNYL
jgi:hypothetical protein